MADDPLHTPLRRRTWRDRLRIRPRASTVAFGLLLLALAGLFAWAWMQPPQPPAPLVVERDLPPRPAVAARAPVDGEAGQVDDEAATDDPDATEEPRGSAPRVATTTAGGAKILDVSKLPDASAGERGATGNGGQVVIEMAGDLRPLSKAPARDLVERSAYGPLPKIGRKGRQPWRVYGRPVADAVLRSSRPKLAVLVVDLGLKAGLTDVALRKLPAAVSLAFAPRGRQVQRLGHAARRNGHEFFLQVPMEPWGYPAVDPGPQTLRSDDVRGNRERLLRVLGRAVGYAGVVTYAGQKFLQQGEALSPVVHELKRRGLLAVDDGTAARSMLADLGLVVGLPVLRADVRMPPGLKPAQARSLLAQARALAAEQGRVLLVVSADAVNLEALRAALAGLMVDPNSPQLVPVTALARMQAQR